MKKKKKNISIQIINLIKLNFIFYNRLKLNIIFYKRNKILYKKFKNLF